MPKAKTTKKVNYGEGPRADYGEGYRYRKSDLSKGADDANDLGGFAGGDRPDKPLPDPQQPDGD